MNMRIGQIDTEMKNLFEMRVAGKIVAMGEKSPDEVYEEYMLKKEIDRKTILKSQKKLLEGNDDWKQKASNFFSYCCDATNHFMNAKEDKQYTFLRKVSSNLFLDNKQLVVAHQFPFSALLNLGSYPTMLPEPCTNITIDFEAIIKDFQDVRYIGELRQRWNEIKKLQLTPSLAV